MKKRYLEQLQRHLLLRGAITHQSAEKMLKVSPVTVRRLFREMAEKHLAIRFHGGIRSVGRRSLLVFQAVRRLFKQF